MCGGEVLYKKHLANEISKYVHWKAAESLEEKEVAAQTFIESNKDLRKMFCGSQCPYKNDCNKRK